MRILVAILGQRTCTAVFRIFATKKATKIGACALLAIQNDCERTRMCGFRRNFVAKILKTAVLLISLAFEHCVLRATFDPH